MNLLIKVIVSDALLELKRESGVTGDENCIYVTVDIFRWEDATSRLTQESEYLSETKYGYIFEAVDVVLMLFVEKLGIPESFLMK